MAKNDSQVTLTDLLRRGTWSAAEVAALLDTPRAIVDRWCAIGLMPGAEMVRGDWQISGRSLFLFCGRKIEPHYNIETVAGLLDKSADTVRRWTKSGRMRVVKIGTAKSASVMIPESELRRWLSL
jgi:excisionase family DNA binding protein